MAKLINLTGQKFGHLEVVRLSSKTDTRKTRYWECICHNCGDVVHIRSDCLRKRGQVSCGCHWYNFKIGDKIHFLTIKRKLGRIDNPNRRRNTINYWECQCDCGNLTKVDTASLTQRSIKSCGCKKFLATNVKYPNNTTMPTYMFLGAMKGASMRHIDFNVSIEDMEAQWIKQNGICALSGIKLFMAQSIRSHKTKERTTASLDRIDSTKAYTVDNIQWIHKDINIMKNSFKQDYFIDLCRKIADEDRI